MLVQAVKKMFRRRYGDALQIKRQRNIAQLGRMIHHHVTFVYLAFNKEKKLLLKEKQSFLYLAKPQGSQK